VSRPGVDSKRWLRLRLWLVGLIFVLAFVVLVGRSVDLQVFERQRLATIAQKEFLRRVRLSPRRGIIFDRNQEELAISLESHSVFAHPLGVTTPRGTGRKLARALGLDARRVIKKLRSERRFTWIARRVLPQRAEAVRRLKLKGVGLVAEPRRFYPYTTLASHVLGYAGADARGLEGLELRYDKVLKGQTATATRLRDALGRTIHLTPEAFAHLPEGRHLILTLDKSVQYHTEKILAQTVAAHRAKGGMAVVMIPQTGEVLAMAVAPGFNPNVFNTYRRSRVRNRVITDVFEPGSTFKTFMAAAALASNKISLDQSFDCEQGQWKIGGRTIHDTHKYGRLNLADIVKFSSNIGAAKVGLALGSRALYRTLRAFGFGQPTGVDLPGEASGILRPYQRWRPVEAATVCYGHGVAVTALQLTQAMAAIANNGVLMRPYLVRAVVDHEARLVKENQPQVVRRVLGVREARLLTAMLVRVTEPGGTGELARMKPFVVAGKTGTAHKVKPGGGYAKNDYISSFIGFVPADDPRVVVLVVIDTPRGKHYGGQVAAPAWAAIARAALDALGVHSLQEAAREPRPAVGRTPAPPPPADTAQVARAAARELAAGRLPDLRGLTLRQVYAVAGRLKLQVRTRGWGRVVRQRPRPGGPAKGRSLRLTLSPVHGGA